MRRTLLTPGGDTHSLLHPGLSTRFTHFPRGRSRMFGEPLAALTWHGVINLTGSNNARFIPETSGTCKNNWNVTSLSLSNSAGFTVRLPSTSRRHKSLSVSRWRVLNGGCVGRSRAISVALIHPSVVGKGGGGGGRILKEDWPSSSILRSWSPRSRTLAVRLDPGAVQCVYVRRKPKSQTLNSWTGDSETLGELQAPLRLKSKLQVRYIVNSGAPWGAWRGLLMSGWVFDRFVSCNLI